MTMWKHVFKHFCKFIKNQKLESPIYKKNSVSEYFVEAPLAAISALSLLE